MKLADRKHIFEILSSPGELTVEKILIMEQFGFTKEQLKVFRAWGSLHNFDAFERHVTSAAPHNKDSVVGIWQFKIIPSKETL